MARKGGKDRGLMFKKGSWWVRIFARGRERTFKCDSKSQAKTLYGRIKAEIREGKYFPEKFKQREDVTLRTWIARCVEGSSNRGIANERRYARFWSLLLGKRLLSALTTEDLRRIQAKLKAKGGKKPATINRHLAFLRHVLMLAVEDRKLARNPVSGLKFFPEARRTRFLSDAELCRLHLVMAPADWQLVAFAIETGLRQAEQFTLRWDQVNLENGVLTLPLPKGGRTRHVPLTEGAKAILRSLDSFVRSPWVFPSPIDPLRPANATSFCNKHYLPALRKAGIAGTVWHTLRHTAASRRVMAGVDLVSVKEFLGHRHIETTMRYAHLAPGHLHEAINRGSLGVTGTPIGTSKIGRTMIPAERPAQVIESAEKRGWLGDVDSNHGNQIQSLMSYH